MSMAEFWDNLDDPRHGTENGYVNLACRCLDCRNAQRIRCEKRRQARAARPIPEHVHGTYNGYSNYNCRCEACRDAHAARRPAALHIRDRRTGAPKCGVNHDIPRKFARTRAQATCGRCLRFA